MLKPDGVVQALDGRLSLLTAKVSYINISISKKTQPNGLRAARKSNAVIVSAPLGALAMPLVERHIFISKPDAAARSSTQLRSTGPDTVAVLLLLDPARNYRAQVARLRKERLFSRPSQPVAASVK